MIKLIQVSLKVTLECRILLADLVMWHAETLYNWSEVNHYDVWVQDSRKSVLGKNDFFAFFNFLNKYCLQYCKKLVI